LFGKLKHGGTVKILLDRDADKLAFEFITDEDIKPKALPPPKKPKAEENV
jgi:ATP-dependent Clp protease ATP-binding subunit ClpA